MGPIISAGAAVDHRFTAQTQAGRPFTLRVVRERFNSKVIGRQLVQKPQPLAESKQKGQTRSIRMEDFLSWGQFFT